MMDININTDILRGIASFLAQNEQYGDDWTEELAELYKVIEYIDAKNGNYDFPSYETILATCLEELEMNVRDVYIVHLPLGYYVEFKYDPYNEYIWALFYAKDDRPVSRVVFWDKNCWDDSQKLYFEHYLDCFFDKLM